LISALIDKAYAAAPSFWERFGEAGLAAARRDSAFHLDYLEAALKYGDNLLFSTYVDWLGRLFVGLGFPDDKLKLTLTALRDSLVDILPAATAEPAVAIVDRSLRADAEARVSEIGQSSPLGSTAEAYLQALLAGDRAGASAQVLELVQGGTPIKSLYLDIFQSVQWEIGRLWLEGKISVGQEHFCTAATQAIMSLLYPAIFASPRIGKTMVAAGVGGELHELGIRMVADLFELEGWDSYYLGTNMPPAGIVAAIRERKAPILCLSVTMTYNLPALEEVLRQLRSAFPDGGVKVMVGGGPFNIAEGLWRRVGADGYAPDAESVVETAAKLLDALGAP
jgi:methanogenic corrinoid protein MtbC1